MYASVYVQIHSYLIRGAVCILKMKIVTLLCLTCLENNLLGINDSILSLLSLISTLALSLSRSLYCIIFLLSRINIRMISFHNQIYSHISLQFTTKFALKKSFPIISKSCPNTKLILLIIKFCQKYLKTKIIYKISKILKM